MKFLLFVSFGRKAFRRPDQAAPNPDAGAAAAPAHGKRRRRAAGGAASRWRPMLGTISEDRVLRERAVAEDKARRPSSAAPADARARGRRHYWDDNRHDTAPSVFPTTAPTAFLF